MGYPNYNTISTEAFNNMQTGVGMLLTTFDIENPVKPTDETIICTTSGGINIKCVPTTKDWGEDVDNCPKNTMEMLQIEGYDCGASFTSLDASKKGLQLAFGFADIDPTTGTIVPRMQPKADDFKTRWFVSPRADGGLVVAKMMNSASVSGLSLQTTDKEKGKMAIELKCFASLEDPNKVPMECYSIDPATSASSLSLQEDNEI